MAMRKMVEKPKEPSAQTQWPQKQEKKPAPKSDISNHSKFDKFKKGNN